MIRYILVGGYPWKANDGGLAFAQALVADHGKQVKLLICLFARNELDWQRAFEADIEFFNRLLPGVAIEYRLAQEIDFTQQVMESDVIYLRGGSTAKLLAALG